MSTPAPRYVVSDLGFAFAVHDTRAPQEYAFEAGRSATHLSSNRLNTRRVELCATREKAQLLADELNDRARAAS
ncbi:MAG: hypothetical protein WD226_10005 [Planctomycetota bacterium]